MLLFMEFYSIFPILRGRSRKIIFSDQSRKLQNQIGTGRKAMADSACMGRKSPLRMANARCGLNSYKPIDNICL